MKPSDGRAIAIVPARTPGPMIDTSRSPQISLLIKREATMMSSAIGRTIVTLGVVLRAAVGGNVDAGTSVTCGDVHGNVDAGRGVTISPRT